MTSEWPRWATTRAEDVRRLLPREEWGPWGRASGRCVSDSPIEGKVSAGAHPSEEPFFFHCTEHMNAYRERRGHQKPWAARDQGLCVACGAPAEVKEEAAVPIVMCVDAEWAGTTVARLRTRRHCSECAPGKRPRCQGTTCRQSKEKLVVRPAGCCALTKSGKRLHCSRCCRAARQKRHGSSVQEKVTRAGLISGMNRRKRQRERRAKVMSLRRDGKSPIEIAAELGVSDKTVRGDIKEALRQTLKARETNSKRGKERHRKMRALHAEGQSMEQIAEEMGVTAKRVREVLKQEETE